MRRSVAVAMLLAGACASEDGQLVVDVRSVLEPGRDFVTVRVEVAEELTGGGVTRPMSVLFTPLASADFDAGVRVAEFDLPGDKTWSVRAELLDRDNVAVRSGSSRVVVRGRTAITIVIDSASTDAGSDSAVADAGSGDGGVRDVGPRLDAGSDAPSADAATLGCSVCPVFEDHTESGSVTVTISSFAYTPRCVRVDLDQQILLPGSTVHPMMGSCAPLDENPIIDVHTSPQTVTFSEPGIYGFHCQNHGSPSGTGMSGAIEVTDRCPARCVEYCATVSRNCTGTLRQYDTEASCLAGCDGLPCGTLGMTSGDSVGCRLYHAGAAAADPMVHCSHAGPSGPVCI